MTDLLMLLGAVVPAGVALFLISDFMLILRTPSHATLAWAYRLRFPLLGLSALLLGLLLGRAAAGVSDAAWGWAAGISAVALSGYAAVFYHPWVFRPLRRPRYVAAEEASRFLAPEDEVIGVEVDGEARAYPIPMIIRPHVVLDRIADRPVAVTYCVLCNSAIAFDRRLGGREIELTPITARNNNIVYWDRSGGNLIQQLEGRVAWGPQRGGQLDALPTAFTTWETWREQHPATKVFLNPPSSFVDATFRKIMMFFGYKRYRGTPNPLFPLRGPLDPRLPSKEMVLGIRIGEEARAYPIGMMRARRVLNDRIGETEIVVLYDPERRCGGIFERRVGDRRLTLEPDRRPESDGAWFIDRETGSRWDVGGRAISGSLSGARLAPLPHFNHTYWFGWAFYHPETKLPPAGLGH